MVEQICKEHSRRQELGLASVPVSVNISAQDFDYVDVPEALNQLLQKYNLPRTSIIVEITEQDMAQATDIFAEQLRRIRDYGYRLWLDDFGSGYSSLNVFSQYQVDRIKFDMDLVRHLDDHGGANRIIMKSIVSMCRQMGVHTLAEGIETEEHYQFLISIDCEMVQGFYFFRPEPLETLGEKLKTDHARTGQDA
jgi:EAL domain-containing protein (putative c-di-GMP-specific phosphodiesterase class I)